MYCITQKKTFIIKSSETPHRHVCSLTSQEDPLFLVTKEGAHGETDENYKCCGQGCWDDTEKQNFYHRIFLHNVLYLCIYIYTKCYQHVIKGFEISNGMHLCVGQVDFQNHFSECTIHLSEIYETNATYVKIRNTQSSVGQVLQVFHLSDCHFYSSQDDRTSEISNPELSLTH